ncbi:MAG: hypothetical protein AB1775_03000 [Bacteroidota bacterium]
MAKGKVHFDIILTSEAREILKNETIGRSLIDGRYFNCVEYNQNGYFLTMVFEHADEELGEFTTEISIPIHFVLYIISDDSTKKIGLL